MATTTVTGAITSASTASTLAGAVLKNTDLVQTGNLDPTKTVTLQSGGTESLSSVSGAAIIANTDAAVTLVGGSGNNQLLVGNDNANTILQAGTGLGQTVVGGAGGQLLGTSTVAGGSATIYGGSGNDTVIAAAGNNVLTAGAGNNLIGIVGGSNQVFAAGNDTVLAAAGNNVIGAGAGNVTIAVGSGSNTVFGGSGYTQIAGSEGGDLLVGNTSKSGTAVLGGFGGNDTLIGGVGNDTLFGGNGNDIFVFSTVFGGGKHIIGDFKAGTDLIAIQGYNLTAAQAAANVTVSGGHSFLSLSDGTKITVLNTTNLTASNFAV